MIDHQKTFHHYQQINAGLKWRKNLDILLSSESELHKKSIAIDQK
jgi:hypothetical protein